jgi:ubiquinone/menaquinone biosynthesis C-methylase UbiE
MDIPMSNLHFNGMSVVLKIRDLARPRRAIVQEVGIKPGFWVLDYGCGPGAYIRDTAKLVGQSGRLYALDIHPLAVQRVEKIAQKEGLTNVHTICSDCETGLPDASLDVVLLYDIFHMLSNPQGLLAELHRVLKPTGILSFSDHHMSQESILAGVTRGAYFELSKTKEHTYSFSKREPSH